MKGQSSDFKLETGDNMTMCECGNVRIKNREQLAENGELVGESKKLKVKGKKFRK